MLSFISVYHVVIAYIMLCTSTFPFTHTLIRLLPTTRGSHVQDFLVTLYFSGVRVIVRFARSWSLSLLVLVFYSLLSFCYFLIFSIHIRFSLYSSFFIWYHAWMLICDIVVIVDLLWFRFIACSGYFRLSVYTWDIFLTYIRHRLSSRLCFHVFWEAGRDRVFLVSEPGLLNN